MAELETLNSADVTTMDTSIRHCGTMIKFWSLKLQLAEIDCRGPTLLRMLETASKQLCEWQKRKDAAWEKRKLDELPKIAEAIEEFRRAGSLLEELH